MKYNKNTDWLNVGLLVFSVLSFLFGWILLLLALLSTSSADAATILLTPTNSIASGIASAATGDTVLVQASTRNESIVLNKAVTVKADGLVTLRPGAYRGIDIQCSNCTVDGFTLENFSQAAATNAGTPRTNVKLLNLKFVNAGAGLWVEGTGWTVERVTLHFRCRDGEDYCNAFGSGHTFRRLFFYGLVIPGDIGPRADGTYKHSDIIQSFVAGGMPGIKNSIVEECIFTDFAEGVYFHNEAGTQDAINGNIVRNNVFWGTDFASVAGTNLVGGPVHTTRFTGPSSVPGQIRNNLYFNANLGITLDRVPGVQVEGNIIYASGAAYALQNMTAGGVNRGTLGNVLWQNNYDGGVSGAPDKLQNPQLQNPAAVGAAVIGPDGIPWTADDAWRVTNATLAAYGPQLAAVAPQPPTATDTPTRAEFDALKARVTVLEARPTWTQQQIVDLAKGVVTATRLQP